MKFFQIKEAINAKQLLEANTGLEAQHAMHDIKTISDALPKVPTEEVQQKKSLINDLKNIKQFLSNFIEKAKADLNQPATESIETEATPDVKRKLDLLSPNAKKRAPAISATDNLDEDAQEILAEIMDMIQWVEVNVEDESKKKEGVARVNSMLDKVTNKFVVLTQERDTARSQRDEAINFVKEVTGVLVQLGNKVQGFEIKDPSELKGKDKTSYNKLAVNAEKFTKTLKQALFGKILDMQEGSDVTQDEIKDFLQACVDGKVINMLRLISVNKGNVKNFVNPNYQKVFDIFVKENIFSYSPGSTSGAIGPGEMALSMMGNPAEKGKKGDLKIGDKEVEIKASDRTGGRFNSKALAKATTGWKIWAAKINQICQNAPKDATIKVKQKDGTFKKMPMTKYDGNQYNVLRGKAKLGSRYNWNGGGLEKLNNEVLEPYSNFDMTYNLFHDTIKGLVQNYDAISKPATNDDGTPNEHHKPFDPSALIGGAIKQNGEVDIEKMNVAYSKIAYTSYHLADGITTVMLLRTDNLNFTIVDDGDDLVDNMERNQVSTGGGFTWNDDQQSPTPGYMSS